MAGVWAERCLSTDGGGCCLAVGNSRRWRRQQLDSGIRAEARLRCGTVGGISWVRWLRQEGTVGIG